MAHYSHQILLRVNLADIFQVHKRNSMLPQVLKLCPENVNVQNANGNTPLNDAVCIFELPLCCLAFTNRL